MKVLKLGLTALAILVLNGCAVAVHDGIEAVKRSSEIKSKSDQLLVDKDKASFIDGVSSIHVSFIKNNLDDNTIKNDEIMAKMFCNYYYQDSKSLSNLKDEGVLIPKCVFGDEKGQLRLIITESKTKEFGFWNQSKFQADFKSVDGTESYHYVDRERDTFPDFFNIVVGVTATIIDVNRS